MICYSHKNTTLQVEIAENKQIVSSIQGYIDDMKLVTLFLPFGIAYASTSLRHKMTIEERLAFLEHDRELQQAKIHNLHSLVETLQAELAAQKQRHLSPSCEPVKIKGVCTFERDVEFEGDVKFSGPDVTFDSEAVFEEEVVFEDTVEFEDEVVLEGNVFVEGPGARRYRRRARKRDLGIYPNSDYSYEDTDTIKFEIKGDVEIDFDSDNEVIFATEAFFDKDVQIGEDPSGCGRRTRRMGNLNSADSDDEDDDDRCRRRARRLGTSVIIFPSDGDTDADPTLFVNNADVASELHVQGILEVIDNAVFSKHLVMGDDQCLDFCNQSGTVHDPDLCDDIDARLLRV